MMLRAQKLIRSALLAVFAVVAFFVTTPAAADGGRGAELAQTCVQCHGAFGADPIANNPILAGQHRKYLLYTLRAYQSGLRANAIMKPLLADMTDADLQALAAYFARQPSSLRD